MKVMFLVFNVELLLLLLRMLFDCSFTRVGFLRACKVRHEVTILTSDLATLRSANALPDWMLL